MSRTLLEHPKKAWQVDTNGFMLWNSGWPWPEGWPRLDDGQAFDGRYRVLHVSLKGKVRLTYPSQADGPYGRPAGNSGPVCSLAAWRLRGLRRSGKAPMAIGCTNDGDCRNHGGP